MATVQIHPRVITARGTSEQPCIIHVLGHGLNAQTTKLLVRADGGYLQTEVGRAHPPVESRLLLPCIQLWVCYAPGHTMTVCLALCEASCKGCYLKKGYLPER